MSTLSELRIARNLTQEKLAQLAGISYATVNRAEAGHPIQRTSFVLLCQALGVKQEDVTGVNLVSRLKARKETRQETE